MELLILFVLLSIFGLIIVVILRSIIRESMLQQQASISQTKELLTITRNDLDGLRTTLRETISSSDQKITSQLSSSTTEINNRLQEANRMMADLKREAGQFSEISRNMKQLQEFLQSPKLRGNIGEQILLDMLKQLLPPDLYAAQFKFKTGSQVDAVIKTEAGLLPIDSKFQMESYVHYAEAPDDQSRALAKKAFLRSAKQYIESIANKYILPAEGTLDFALMYVPSETVFYELIQDAELMDRANKIRVMITSPTTLYMYLQAIFISNQGKRLEKRSQELMQLLRAVEKEHEKVTSSFQVLGRHIQNASSSYSTVQSGMQGLANTIAKSKSLELMPPHDTTSSPLVEITP